MAKNPSKGKKAPATKSPVLIRGDSPNTDDDDLRFAQNYHELHQSLGERFSESCQMCKAKQEYNEYAPISDIDSESF